MAKDSSEGCLIEIAGVGSVFLLKKNLEFVKIRKINNKIKLSNNYQA